MTARPLHIGIAGPIATCDVAHLLDAPAATLPPGIEGAPLLATLVEALLRQGHRVSAFTLSKAMPLRDDARALATGPRFALHLRPIRPRAWPPNGRLPGRIVDLYAFERRGLCREMLAARPDVVHAHWSCEYAWAALATGLPHVVTCHDCPVTVARHYRGFRHGAYRWLRAGIAWHALRRAQGVTAVSPYLAGRVQPLCRVPVAVVPNPIPADAPPPPPGEPGRERVLLVGNGFEGRKNGAAALRAFAELARRRPRAELHAYGDGFEPGGPAARWRDAHPDAARIVFHGPVPHREVLAAMAASDLLLHPSLEESFGAVLAEAMAAGLPVVAGERSGAVPWVVGDAGLLVDVDDPRRMAEAMAALLDDAAGRRDLGRRGRVQVAGRFAPSAVAARYVDLYLAAIERARPTP